MPTVESSRKRSVHHPQNRALHLGPVLLELIHRGLPGIECLAQEAVLHFLQDARQFVPICILLGRNAVPLTQGHTTESPEKVQKSLVAEIFHVRTHFRPLFPLLESIVTVFSKEKVTVDLPLMDLAVYKMLPCPQHLAATVLATPSAEGLHDAFEARKLCCGIPPVTEVLMRLIASHVEEQRPEPFPVFTDLQSVVSPCAQCFALEGCNEAPQGPLQAPCFASAVSCSVMPGMHHCTAGAAHPEHEGFGGLRREFAAQVSEVAPKEKRGTACIGHEKFRRHTGLLRPLNILRKPMQDFARNSQIKVLKGTEIGLLDALAPFCR